MGFEVQVYRRAMPEGTLGMDGEPCSGKYECHMNGRCFAAGMESIPEMIDEISETFRNRCESSDEMTISSPEPRDPKLRSLIWTARKQFAKLAPLFSYAPCFLWN